MKIRYLLFLLSFCWLSNAQQMDNAQLLEIITQKTDSIEGTVGSWQFMHQGVQLLCITDANNNRMRIMSPITPSHVLDKELLLDAMTANFHSALDVRYAIANDILWAAFIHPLRELSTKEVESAISQVYLAAKTFGTTFSSTSLIFSAGQAKEEEPEKKDIEFQKL